MVRNKMHLLVFILFVPTMVGAALAVVSKESKQVTPSHVFVHVGTVRSELEALRFVMGRPKNEQPELNVKGAAPRDVYFQALTLFQKADRLCFEHTRQRATPPALPIDNITAGDVHEVVNAALKCVRRVRAKYGDDTNSVPIAHDPTKQPSEVFKSIVQANRQLNLMLERRFSPSDVFQQVTLAVGYSARLLERFPDATTIPDEPAFEKGKRPADVYRRLLGCVERVRRIARSSGLEVLELQIDENQIWKAEPSDVYDVASLIVAELAYLHSQLPDLKPPRAVYYVGRKFPSHVFQRAGILDRQLMELERHMQEHSNWLKREPAE